MDPASLGKQAISEDSPAGADVRYEPVFEELQAEIDKMSNPSASGEMDWNKVNTLAAEILSAQAKDLLVASYFAVAQIHTAGIEGFGLGLHIYCDLLETFWEDLFPKKKRMRGRIAAIEWWLEKSEKAMESLAMDPVPADTVEQFRQDLRKIDSLLQEYLDEAPLLRPLERYLDRIPIQAEKEPEPEAAPVQEKEPEAEPASKAPVTPKPVSAQPPPEVSVPGAIGSESDANKVLREAFQAVRKVAAFFLGRDLCDPNGYRLRRVAAWAMIEALPPATDGKTQIPPPSQHETALADLKALQAKGDWQALVRLAEEKLEGALLWLDLNRFSAEGLSMLGDPYQRAHDAVCRETAHLIHRIPGIEQLAYADGTPLADADTRQWLQEISLGASTAPVGPMTGGGSSSAESERMAQTIEEARTLAKKKKVSEAVSMLQRELRTSFSKQEQLLWRLGLSQILVQAKKIDLALPHLESVLQDIDTYKLEEWDPQLALRGLKMVWLGLKNRSDDLGKERGGVVLNRIAKLDPAEALALGK